MKRTVLLLVIALVFADHSFAQPKGKPGKTPPIVRGVAPESMPNVLVDVSAPLIDAILRRPIDRSDPIDEIIQDAPVKGMGRTIGVVTAEVIPDAKKAVVELVFRGQVHGDTSAVRTFVSVEATATTQLEVRRRLVIDSGGIQSLPGANFGRTAISLVQIKPNLPPEGLAVKVATEMFRRTRADAEFETSTKAAWNTSRKIHTELTPALAGISKAAMESNVNFKKAGLATRDLTFSSTADGVQARLRFDTPISVPPSPAPSKGVDLGVRVHESVINEAARANVGGKSFSLDQMQKLSAEFGSMLRDGRSEKDQKDGEKNMKIFLSLPGPAPVITFAEKAPFTLGFTEQGITFEIDIASMEHDKKVYQGMRVKAEYRIDHAKEGIVFVRKGAIKFLPPSASDKKLEAVPFAFTLVREMLFAEVLKERLLVPSPPLPEPMRHVRLHPPRAGARDGWFALAWTLAQ